MLRLRSILKSKLLLALLLSGSFMCGGAVLSCETATIESGDGANVCLDQFPSILDATCYLEKENKTQAQLDWGTKDCREPRAIREEIKDANKAMALAVTLSPNSPQIAFSMDAYKTWKDFNDAYALDRCKELAISKRVDLSQYPCVLVGRQTNRRNLMRSSFSQQEITDFLKAIDQSIKIASHGNNFEKQTTIPDDPVESKLGGVDVSAGLGPNGSCQSASIRSSDGSLICLDNFPMIVERKCRESGYAIRAYRGIGNLGSGYQVQDCDGTTFLEDINKVSKRIVLFASETPQGIFYSFAVDGAWDSRPITERLAEERCRQYLSEKYVDQREHPCNLIGKSSASNPRVLLSDKQAVEIKNLLSKLHEEIVNPKTIGAADLNDQLHQELLNQLTEEREEIAAQRRSAEEERQRLEREYERALEEIEKEKLRIAEQERQIQESLNESDAYVDDRKRVALLIGNSHYRTLPKLLNPSNDVQSMRRALMKASFDVSVYENLDLRGMQDTLRAFGELLDEETVGLFYFAGHGMQFEGKNYLVPVDENIIKPYELQTAALDLSLVTNTLKYASNDLNIVILDACRNNTLAASRGGDRGFAAVSAAEGIFIAFSTAPGQAALDGAGENSPYTKYLARAIESSSNVSIEALFKQVRAQVMDETKKQQIPWENSSLLGEFRFR